MRRAVVLALAIASCVPSGEEADPRGALGLATVPSPIARGESFVTKDGWTVHVEELVVLAAISGNALDPASEDVLFPTARASSRQGPYLFKASRPETFVAPGLPVGAGGVWLPYHWLVLGPSRRTNEPDEMETRNVEPALVARFHLPSESFEPTLSTTWTAALGPSILLIARGEKGGRVVRIDFAFRGAVRPFNEIPLEIRANTVNQAPLAVAAESLFSGPTGYELRCEVDDAGVLKPRSPTLSSTSELVFDDLASADADGDGKLSAAELRRPLIPPRCECCSSVDDESVRNFTSSMAALLEARSGELLLQGREPSGGP
ncbi:MAG: hypothetical protein KF795_02085 [Labilithrix sp.]|nr:hypothetical protein [Labilithrix sp.]